jgi:hypothetical protein
VGSNLVLVIRRSTLILAVGLLVMTLLSLAFALFGGWNDGHTMLYWGAILYSRTALLLAAISLPVFIILLILWTTDRLRHRPVPRVGGWSVSLSLAALLMACAAALPTFLVRLTHLDSARLGEHVYQLMFRTALDGDNYYVLYECDGLGLVCAPQMTSGYSPESVARIIPDPVAKTVSIEVNGETVQTYHLPP